MTKLGLIVRRFKLRHFQRQCENTVYIHVCLDMQSDNMTLSKCCVNFAVSAEISHDEMRQKYKVMSYQEQDRYFDVTSRHFYSRSNG